MADLARRVMNSQRDDLPRTIQTAPQRALYNNLNQNEELTIACDEAVRCNKLADWKGDEKKEEVLKAAIYKVLKSVDEVERIFPIIKQQHDY